MNIFSASGLRVSVLIGQKYDKLTQDIRRSKTEAYFKMEQKKKGKSIVPKKVMRSVNIKKMVYQSNIMK